MRDGDWDSEASGSRVDELEEMQWSVVWQEDAGEAEGEGL